MTLPALLRLAAKVGDTTSLSFEWNEDDGTPIDISGWSAEFSVSKGRKGGLGNWTYLSTSDPSVISIVPSDPDPVKLVITPAMSREWTGGKAVVLQFEVTLTDPSGARTSILDGELDMRGEVRFEP